MPQPVPIEGVNARISAMLNALAIQRNQSADEVVNLLGDLADAREKIAALEKELSELKNAADAGSHPAE